MGGKRGNFRLNKQTPRFALLAAHAREESARSPSSSSGSRQANFSSAISRFSHGISKTSNANQLSVAGPPVSQPKSHILAPPACLTLSGRSFREALGQGTRCLTRVRSSDRALRHTRAHTHTHSPRPGHVPCSGDQALTHHPERARLRARVLRKSQIPSRAAWSSLRETFPSPPPPPEVFALLCGATQRHPQPEHTWRPETPARRDGLNL